MATIILCGSSKTPSNDENYPISQNINSHLSYTTFSKTNVDYSLARYGTYQELENDFLANFKNSKQLQIVKLLLSILFLFPLFKSINKESFLIFLIRIQYFISDLKIHLLSSRAHPPTQ
jgi:hypothetical protein